MARTWIMVAEEGRARLLGREKLKSSLSEIESFTNPAGHMHETALTSDLPGRASATGAGRHKMGAENGPKAHASEVFAKSLADRLDDGRKQNHCERLVLVAPPKFLGLLRGHLSDESTRMVVKSLDKNLVRSTLEEIRDELDRD